MRENETSAPHPIDVYVGKMIRAYRLFTGMTLSEIGTAVGVSPQQFNRYEQAAIRIPASRLFQIARALRMSPVAFFEGLEDEEEERQSIFDRYTDFFASPYAARLADVFMRMDPPRQRMLIKFAETIVEPDT